MVVYEIIYLFIVYKLGLMRNVKISSKDFCELVLEVGNLFIYEVIWMLFMECVVIKSWLGDEVEVK